ncbi:MAG: hypothetical protein J7M38_00480, partial [Armatimonadetes bacterium]|nr:hypothetical protein [Armatimonadota bacterium]
MRSSLRDTVNKSAGLYAPGGSLPGAWGPAVACLMTLLLAGAVCAQHITSLQVGLWDTGLGGQRQMVAELVRGFQRANPD